MNVLQVTSRYPPQAGGLETHVREVATRLADRGHAVTVLTADAGGDGDRRETIEGVAVRRYRGLAPGGAFHVAPAVALAVRRADADVVHAHNYHSLPLLFAALGATAPLVATPHYHAGGTTTVRELLHRPYQYAGGWALRRAAQVIAVSEWEKEALARDLGVEASVIPNGVDVDRFAAATPADRDRPYLLCVGRLAAYKGVQHLVRALSDLPGYDLVVAGTGPYADDLAALARDARVADRVAFEGFVPDDRLPELYAGATAFVTLSTFEAFGLTVGEALAAGTPCVVRERAALAEWADRPDCVGVDDVAAGPVAAAVREAASLSAPAAPLPTWDGAVDDLETVYGRVTGRE